MKKTSQKKGKRTRGEIYNPNKAYDFNSIQGKIIPEKLTREFVSGLDIEKMTKQECRNLVTYSILQALKIKNQKGIIKRAMNLTERNKNFGLDALLVEMALTAKAA
ncbi:MAG: hypothetical protein AB1427_17180 [Thermodesulfobacteriota bacterium]